MFVSAKGSWPSELFNIEFLPLRIGKDEFSKFEISKDNPLFVAGADRLGHLAEEPPRLGFAQPLPVPDVGVKVSMRGREHQVHEFVTQEHLVEWVDVRVTVEAVVRRQQGVRVPSDHLQHNMQLRSAGDHEALIRLWSWVSERVIKNVSKG